jgi:hypothetical protein
VRGAPNLYIHGCEALRTRARLTEHRFSGLLFLVHMDVNNPLRKRQIQHWPLFSLRQSRQIKP